MKLPVLAVAAVAWVALPALATDEAATNTSPAAPSTTALVVEPGVDWNALCLRRAVGHWTAGDVPAALDALAARDDAQPDVRVDFLGAYGTRRTRDPRVIGSLVENSDWGRWLAVLHRLDRNDAAGAVKLTDGDEDPHQTLSDARRERENDHAPRRYEQREAGFAALGEGRWADAYAALDAATRAWRRELDRVNDILDEDWSVDAAWRSWQSPAPGDLTVDAAVVEAGAADHVARFLDLEGKLKSPRRLRLSIRRATTESSPVLPRPAAELRAETDRLAAALTDARAELAHSERALSLTEVEALREQRYFALGGRRVGAEIATTDAALARLDVLIARTDRVVAALGELRDTELSRIAMRIQRFLETARRQRVIANAQRHLRVKNATAQALPAGVPSPDEILAADALLTSDFEHWFEAFSREAAERVRRSHDEIWVPRATDGLTALVTLATARRSEEDRLAFGIDVMRAAAMDSDRFAEARGRVAGAVESVTSLEASLLRERRRVVRKVAKARRKQLIKEGEGLLWAVAVADHENALLNLVNTDADTDRGVAHAELRRADARWLELLDRYPKAPAYDEARFRLADVRLALAREDFRVAMTRFIGGEKPAAGSDSRALAPFVDYVPALEIYLALVDDAPDFRHRDAVLFHAGMILSDDGDASSREYLLALVNDFPQSEYGQEAHLRLADDHFAEKDFRAAVAHYGSAADGRDPQHAAIALYKQGWAHYNLEGFDDAARAFRRLLDLYEVSPGAARTTDLRAEAADHLVHALARSGGAPAFARLFPENAPAPPYEQRTLTALGRALRHFSLLDEAMACDSLWLTRYPLDPKALEAATRLVRTLDAREREADAHAQRLALADRFRLQSPWGRSVESDSIRAAGDAWAHESVHRVALYHHRAAREEAAPTDWRRALDLYENLISGWPGHASGPQIHFYAGEAAAALADARRAIGHFETAAASDTASFRADAAWQAVSVRDAWYERELATLADAPDARPEVLARELLESIDAFRSIHSTDARSADLLWRRGHVAHTHGWRGESIASFDQFVNDYPLDTRRAMAARLSADALYASENFPGAADAYSLAANLAREAGDDETAALLEPLVPVCHDREALRLAETYGDGRESARAFEYLADRWPAYEHAHRSLYRAGLGYDADGETEAAVGAWTVLARRYPDSEYVRDSRLSIARAWEANERPAAAATAYHEFATDFPKDPDASAALMLAADLFVTAGDVAASETAKTLYLKQYPDDVETRLEILEERAVRELDTSGPGSPISGLLALAPADGIPSHLARYLALVQDQPEIASSALLARVRFLRGEEARSEFDRARITLPLGTSVAQKKSLLEKVLKEYQGAAAYAVAPWNRASAVRVGECLVAFGDALMDAERPADLGEDDLIAFEEILEEQSWEFFDRGEEAWTQLVQQANDPSDVWVTTAKQQLWPRVASRFLHRPEVEYPLVRADDVQPEEAH